MPVPSHHYKDLCALFASIDNPKEADSLLQDILTPREIEAIAERWQIIKQLAAGKPQREVAKNLEVSISKVTRGSRFLHFGTGGFQHFIEKSQRK